MFIGKQTGTENSNEGRDDSGRAYERCELGNLPRGYIKAGEILSALRV